MPITTETFARWLSLPDELKLEIIYNLSLADSKAFSKTGRRPYRLCVPVMFKSVKLHNLEQLLSFLENVPPAYRRHIRELDLCTEIRKNSRTVADNNSFSNNGLDSQAVTDAVISLISTCPRLNTLALRTAGSLEPRVALPFASLTELRQLTLENCALPESQPLSERLVVSIAATVPRLERLFLDRVSRSMMHAPDLDFSNPTRATEAWDPPFQFRFLSLPLPPLVIGDESVPDHSDLGNALSLPSLLSIPTLRVLALHDTNLGDPRWSTTPVRCHKLEVLDFACGGGPGPCPYASEAQNASHIRRLLTTVGPTIEDLALSTFPFSVLEPFGLRRGLMSDGMRLGSENVIVASTGSRPGLRTTAPASSCPPLNRLRTLRLSPFFPMNKVQDTLLLLSGFAGHDDGVRGDHRAASRALVQSTVAPRAPALERIVTSCFEDDTEELCAALESFLLMRAEETGCPGSDKAAIPSPRLNAVEVKVGCDEDTGSRGGGSRMETKVKLGKEAADATRKLKELCGDLGIECVLSVFPAAHLWEQGLGGRSKFSPVDSEDHKVEVTSVSD